MATGVMSPVHLALLLGVLLMVFGAKRLPEMGRSLGSGLRGFRRSLEGDDDGAVRPGASPAAPRVASVPTSGPAQPAEGIAEPRTPDAAA